MFRPPTVAIFKEVFFEGYITQTAKPADTTPPLPLDGVTIYTANQCETGHKQCYQFKVL
jgi:hypothetical protein